MRRTDLWRPLGALLLGACSAWAAGPPAPALAPGEAFVRGDGIGPLEAFGEARREWPLGGLAELVWLQAEGSEWGSRALAYRCRGTWNDRPCGAPKGHGKVDLSKALQEGCHGAFHAWAQVSHRAWKDTYGDGAARTRLEEAFGPFLGRRLPAGEELPAMTPAWMGEGDLLRATPEAYLRWLLDPARDGLLDLVRRHLNGPFSSEAWWFKAAPASLSGDPKGGTWALASDGRRAFLLYLPQAVDRKEALARLRTLMGPLAQPTSR